MHPLVSAYLDGDMLPEEQEELRAWLRADPEHLAEFVFSGCLHSQLRELALERGLRASATELGAAKPASPIDTSADAGPRSEPPAQDSAKHVALPSPEAASPRFLTWPSPRVVWALALLAAVGLAGGVYGLIASRPAVVAQLTRATDCVWVDAGHDAQGGELLKTGREMRLSSGTAEVTFTSGANVVLSGASRFQLRGPDAGALDEGELLATVPKSAVGFRVITPRATLVDLGTEFSLRVAGDGSLDLVVLQGLVELQPKDAAGNELNPLRIPYGRAIHLDAMTGRVTTVPFQFQGGAGEGHKQGE